MYQNSTVCGLDNKDVLAQKRVGGKVRIMCSVISRAVSVNVVIVII